MPNIKSYLNYDNYITVKELCQATGKAERAVRRELQALRRIEPVISLSSGKGYKLAKPFEACKSVEELIQEMKLIQHFINETESRKKELSKSETKCIAYMKLAEIYLKEHFKAEYERIKKDE